MHVLGTPPAFILSQDQTLMLKSLSFKSLIFPESLLAYSDNSEFTVLRLLLFTEAFVCQSSLLVLTAWNLLSICWSILESFKVYSLFSYQGSLWFFQTVLLSATFIGYHIFKSLSTTFFIFLLHFFSNALLSFIRDSLFILSNHQAFVNNFFYFSVKNMFYLRWNFILPSLTPYVNRNFAVFWLPFLSIFSSCLRK